MFFLFKKIEVKRKQKVKKKLPGEDFMTILKIYSLRKKCSLEKKIFVLNSYFSFSEKSRFGKFWSLKKSF
jgi:hypothetical protein